MARRQIGQESFGFAQGERGRNGRLDAIDAALDWRPIAGLLDGIHASAKGEPAWPPLALFKALLLGLWHDLSDVSLAEALDDRASFRRFCGFASGEAVPERTAFVRFRKALVDGKLDEALFRAVVRQLETRGLVVRTGTLVDATVIAQASKTDGEARWYRTAKRSYGLGRARYVGLERVSLQAHLTFLAYNLTRAVGLLAAKPA